MATRHTKSPVKPPPGKRTRGPAEPVRHPRERREPFARRRLATLAVIPVAIAAGVAAFLLGRGDAQGPSQAVEAPAAGLPDTPDYHSLLVDPQMPDRVLLGTHVGIYESTNGGRAWSFFSLEGNDAMNLARVGEGTVWAAGHNVLARSDDGGTTWSDVRPDGLPGLDVHGFTQDAGDPERLYAAIAGQGLYRSDDGGATFTLASDVVGPGVLGLATADGRILAADPERGVLASSDGGVRWEPLLEQPGTVGVVVNPSDPQRVIVTGPGIFLSTDGGATWEQVLALSEGAGPVAWAPSDPDVAYAVGYDRTLYRTDDRGATWRPVE